MTMPLKPYTAPETLVKHKKPYVAIERNTIAKIRYITDSFPKEWQFWCCIDVKDIENIRYYKISGLVIPEQEVTGSNTESNITDGFALINECEAVFADPENPRYWEDRKDHLSFWGHSHVNFAPGPSSVDEARWKEFAPGWKGGVCAMFILNKSGDYTLRIQDDEIGVTYQNLPIHEIDLDDYSECDKIMKERFRDRPPPKVTTTRDTFTGGYTTPSVGPGSKDVYRKLPGAPILSSTTGSVVYLEAYEAFFLVNDTQYSYKESIPAYYLKKEGAIPLPPNSVGFLKDLSLRKTYTNTHGEDLVFYRVEDCHYTDENRYYPKYAPNAGAVPLPPLERITPPLTETALQVVTSPAGLPKKKKTITTTITGTPNKTKPSPTDAPNLWVNSNQVSVSKLIKILDDQIYCDLNESTNRECAKLFETAIRLIKRQVNVFSGILNITNEICCLPKASIETDLPGMTRRLSNLFEVLLSLKGKDPILLFGLLMIGKDERGVIQRFLTSAHTYHSDPKDLKETTWLPSALADYVGDYEYEQDVEVMFRNLFFALLYAQLHQEISARSTLIEPISQDVINCWLDVYDSIEAVVGGSLYSGNANLDFKKITPAFQAYSNGLFTEGRNPFNETHLKYLLTSKA